MYVNTKDIFVSEQLLLFVDLGINVGRFLLNMIYILYLKAAILCLVLNESLVKQSQKSQIKEINKDTQATENRGGV